MFGIFYSRSFKGFVGTYDYGQGDRMTRAHLTSFVLEWQLALGSSTNNLSFT